MSGKTLKGIPMEKVPQYLDQPLSAEAYKAIGGGNLKDLTDIKQSWMYAVLDRLFGPVGIGWRYGFNAEDVKSEGTTTLISRLWVQYRYVDDNGDEQWSNELSMPAANTNKAEGVHSLKGAVTAGLGGVWSIMGWQASVYAGVRNHERVNVCMPGTLPLPADDVTLQGLLYRDDLDKQVLREYLADETKEAAEEVIRGRGIDWLRGMLAQIPESHRVKFYDLGKDMAKANGNGAVKANGNGAVPAPKA